MAFLYLGVRGRGRLWPAFAGLYFAAAVAAAVLRELEGEEATSSGFLWLCLAAASFAHTLALRPAFEERLELVDDPALDAAEDHEARRAQVAELVVAGRPYSSLEGMDLVVNVPPDQLARLREAAVFLPLR